VSTALDLESVKLKRWLRCLLRRRSA